MIGFVNLNKAEGMTSNDAVVRIRRILSEMTGEKIKIGHTGTLDPLASGVLPLAVGRATKLFDYITSKRKVYRAAFRFGETTDTLDRGGIITECGGIIPTVEQIENVLPRFIGRIDQIPPVYSAKSVGGMRAYKYARRGIEVKLEPKTVHIESVKILNEHALGRELSAEEFGFEIVCGPGTYIRAIARDIAAALGTLGYMSYLCRVEAGGFGIEDAVNCETFAGNPEKYLLPPEVALADYRRAEIDEPSLNKLFNGIAVNVEACKDKGLYLITYEGKATGLAENTEGGLRMRVHL